MGGVDVSHLILCGDQHGDRTCELLAGHHGQHMAFNATRPLITSWYPRQPWKQQAEDLAEYDKTHPEATP